MLGCGGERASLEFGEFRVEDIAETRAVVRFDTSLPASSVVLYGTSADDLDHEATDIATEPGGLSYEHEVPLEDLVPDTEYHWRAEVVDRDNVISRSGVDAFVTLEGQVTPEPDNVALLSAGAEVVEVSSNWAAEDNGSTYGANNAFDGRMATEWASDGDGDDAWVELDFGSIRTLESFAFRSRQMNDGSAIVREVELVFDDHEVRGPFETPDPTVRYAFPLTPPLAAERVRIRAVETTGGNAGAREIQFYEQAEP
jgi:hypothetical protein